jgi:hypothetical protein
VPRTTQNIEDSALAEAKIRAACLCYAIEYAPGGLTQFAILKELLLMASGPYKMRVTTVCAGA